jgi:uncharacterized membrane protein YhaH (DUF805 family)
MSNTPLKDSGNDEIDRLLKNIDSGEHFGPPRLKPDCVPSNPGVWQSYLTPWRKFAVFQGRSGRREYWIFYGFNLVPSLLLSCGILFADDRSTREICTILSFGLMLATLVPSLAVSVRRLHDIGLSGWVLLVGVIPFLGPLAIIAIMAKPGDAKANNYGPVPGRDCI